MQGRRMFLTSLASTMSAGALLGGQEEGVAASSSVLAMPHAMLRAVERTAIELYRKPDHFALSHYAATARLFFDVAEEYGHHALAEKAMTGIAGGEPLDLQELEGLIRSQAGMTHLPADFFTRVQEYVTPDQLVTRASSADQLRRIEAHLVKGVDLLSHQAAGGSVSSPVSLHYGTYGVVVPHLRLVQQQGQLTTSQAQVAQTSAGATAVAGGTLMGLGFGSATVAETLGAGAFVLGSLGAGLVVLGLGVMMYVGYQALQGNVVPEAQPGSGGASPQVQVPSNQMHMDEL